MGTMGRRRGPSGELCRSDGITFVQTKLVKSRCAYCSKCPNKLFAGDEENIVFGAGTIVTNTVLILPTVEEHYFDNSNIINILANVYNSYTNRNMFEDVYVTFATKCHRLRDYDTFSESYKHCKAILKYELYKIHPTDVVLLGPYTHSLLGNEDVCGYVRLHRLINPNVFYTDKQLWEVFKKHFGLLMNQLLSK